MKHLFFFLLLLFGTIIEWSIASSSTAPLAPPLTLLALILWFFSLSFSSRFFLAVIAGLFFDSASILPFGVHMLLFTLVALLVEVARRALSNIDSLFMRWGSIGILIFLGVFFLGIFSWLFGLFFHTPVIFSLNLVGSLIIITLYWVVAFSVAGFGIEYAFFSTPRSLFSGYNKSRL